MHDEKLLMSEVATLYYTQGCTQQEIAKLLGLSRQTVSKLLSDALKTHIVEITVHDPQRECNELTVALRERFGIEDAVVCGVGHKSDTIRQLEVVKAGASFIRPLIQQGGLKIAVSWGRTIESLIAQLPDLHTEKNVVFPLFGATDHDRSCFASNELARAFADKLSADVRYAWFPYMPDTANDCALFQKTSHYRTLQQYWETIDLAIVGIGNTEVLELFAKTFGYREKHTEVIGDVATHFFTEEGDCLELYDNTLCASSANLKTAKHTVAIACGSAKVRAIAGALRTGMINTLITDEYTAKELLEH